MPWRASEAKTHNKDAVGKKAQVWADVANRVLRKTGDDGRAIREANAAIARVGKRKK